MNISTSTHQSIPWRCKLRVWTHTTWVCILRRNMNVATTMIVVQPTWYLIHRYRWQHLYTACWLARASDVVAVLYIVHIVPSVQPVFPAVFTLMDSRRIGISDVVLKRTRTSLHTLLTQDLRKNIFLYISAISIAAIKMAIWQTPCAKTSQTFC